MIPPNNILITFAIPPPPPAPCPHFPNKFKWSSFWILQKFSTIHPFGVAVTTDPPLYSPKNQVRPLKILRPLPQPINNDRSLSIYSYFSTLTVQVLGKNRWNYWLRYFHTFAEGGTVMSGEQRGKESPQPLHFKSLDSTTPLPPKHILKHHFRPHCCLIHLIC